MSILNHLDEVIEEFDTEFTTHKFILVLAKNNQREYIESLSEQNGEQPFKDLHSRIGNALSTHPSVETNKTIKSENIFGISSQSPVWVRIN